MKKKIKLTESLLVIAVIALIVAAAFLLVDRTTEKHFSKIVPEAESFDSCKVICITVDRADETTITGDDFQGLLDHLNQVRYYNRGKYSSTIEGTIYHIYFYSRQAEPFYMIVSDLGRVYIGSEYYDFDPDVPADSISSYLEAFLG